MDEISFLGFGLMIAAYQVGFTRPQLSSALYAAG
jgi:hypothetical protein